MQERWTAKAWMDFFRYGAASDNVASFEEQCGDPRSGKIKRSNQSIVAGADDNDHQLFHSRRIFFAAFNPGAPMMPPPGCVADPHI